MILWLPEVRSTPGWTPCDDDLLGLLVRDHGDELSTTELVGIATQLLIAGHETTANVLGMGMLALPPPPTRDDPSIVAAAVEELLRWLSVMPSGPPKTTTTAQTVIAGRPDLTRGATAHVVFGHGVHHHDPPADVPYNGVDSGKSWSVGSPALLAFPLAIAFPARAKTQAANGKAGS